MRGGNSEGGEEFSIPVCDSRRWRWSREIPAFAGMGKGGEWGSGGNGSAGAGEETKKITKKYSPIPAKAGISRWLGQDGQRPACTASA